MVRMRLGVVSNGATGQLDLVLARLAERLTARGVRLAGTVQINTDCGPGRPCDMDVKLLPDGPVLRISQSLGDKARGCRLDTDALARAVGLAQAQFAAGSVDLLIVNKFGKSEAAGGGFRDLVAEALAAGVPVIVGLNALNRAAFDAFTGGMAEGLEADPAALEDWVQKALEARSEIRPAPAP